MPWFLSPKFSKAGQKRAAIVEEDGVAARTAVGHQAGGAGKGCCVSGCDNHRSRLLTARFFSRKTSILIQLIEDRRVIRIRSKGDIQLCIIDFRDFILFFSRF